MAFKSIALAVTTLILSTSVNAATITVVGSSTTVGNCIPFGCPGNFDPHMGFIYQNIESFALNPGDIIAFDLGDVNDQPLNFDISLAQTALNGGRTANSSGFTTVVTNGVGSGQGNGIVGDFDLAFTIDTAFTFSGGGLIIDFLAVGDSINDASIDQTLVYSNADDASGLFVGRYASANTVGGIDAQYILTDAVGHFQLSTAVVPVPAAAWLFGSGLMGLIGVARRKNT